MSLEWLGTYQMDYRKERGTMNFLEGTHALVFQGRLLLCHVHAFKASQRNYFASKTILKSKKRKGLFSYCKDSAT